MAELKTIKKFCEICGKEFECYKNSARFCKDCRRKRSNDRTFRINTQIYTNVKPSLWEHRTTKHNVDLAHETIAARNKGMTYGQFKAAQSSNQVTVIVPRNLTSFNERVRSTATQTKKDGESK